MDRLWAALSAARAGDAPGALWHVLTLRRTDDEALDVMSALAAGDVQYAVSILEDMLEDAQPVLRQEGMSHLSLRGVG